jgi:hypothetical protein
MLLEAAFNGAKEKEQRGGRLRQCPAAAGVWRDPKLNNPPAALGREHDISAGPRKTLQRGINLSRVISATQ